MSTKVLITAFTSFGAPQTGLSPEIRIRDVNSTALVETGSMTEVGDGFYKYIFNNYSSTLDYAIRFDGGSSLDSERYTFATNDSFADDVWDEPQTLHTGSVFLSGSSTAVTSSGEMLNFVHDIEGGRWRIASNQMVFFKPDGTTEIARFNLFDITGSATQTEVSERIRIS